MKLKLWFAEFAFLVKSTELNAMSAWLLAPAIVFGLIGSSISYILGGLFQKATTFTVGSLVWDGLPKSGDYALLFTFPFFVYISFLFASSTLKRAKIELGDDFEFVVARQIRIFTILLLSWGLSNVVSRTVSLLGLATLILIFSVVSFSVITQTYRRQQSTTKLDLETWKKYFHQVITIFPVSIAGCLGLLVLYSRLGKSFIEIANLNLAAVFVGAGIFLPALVLLISQFIKSIYERTFFLTIYNFLAAVPGALLVFVLVPQIWVDKNGIETQVGFKPALIIVLIAFAALYLVSNFRIHFPKFGNEIPALSRVSKSYIFLTPLIYLKSFPVGIQTLSPDDFHFGEFVVPWSQFTNFGSAPFAPLEAARGGVNFTPGLASNIFYSQSIEAFPYGFYMIYALILLLALPVLHKFLPIWLVFIVLAIFPGANGLSEIDLITAIFLLWIAHLLMSHKTWAAIVSYIFGGIPLFIYGPAQATLVLVSLAFPLAYSVARNASLIRWKSLLLVLLSAICFVILTPVKFSFFGALQYLIGQGSVNTEAYGIPWIISFANPSSNPFLYESLRFSWVLVPTVILIASVQAWREKATRNKFVFLLIPIAVLSLLAITKAAGRIDPGTASRPGAFSFFVFVILVPVLAMSVLSKRGNLGLGTSLVALAIISPLLPDSNVYGTPVANAVSQVNKVAVGEPTEKQFLLNRNLVSRLGNMQIEREKFGLYTEVGDVLSAILKKNETFLDLTNHSAYYAYFDRRVPLSNAAMYTLVTENQQVKAIADLRKKPMSLILISGQTIVHDGGGFALRNFLLHKYITGQLGQFNVLKGKETVWLASKAISLDAVRDANLKLLTSQEANLEIDKVWKIRDLAFIPGIWGKAIGTLDKKLVEFPNIEQSQSRQNSDSVAGELAVVPKLPTDFIQLDVQCSKPLSSVALTLKWQGTLQGMAEMSSLTFRGSSGTQLIPMYSQSDWLRLESISNVILSTSIPETCPKLIVKNIKFLNFAELIR